MGKNLSLTVISLSEEDKEMFIQKIKQVITKLRMKGIKNESEYEIEVNVIGTEERE